MTQAYSPFSLNPKVDPQPEAASVLPVTLPVHRIVFRNISFSLRQQRGPAGGVYNQREGTIVHKPVEKGTTACWRRLGCCSDKWKHPIAGMTQMWNDHSSGSAPWWKPRFNIVVNGNFSKIRLETGQHWNLVESSQKATLESVLEHLSFQVVSCRAPVVPQILLLSFCRCLSNLKLCLHLTWSRPSSVPPAPQTRVKNLFLHGKTGLSPLGEIGWNLGCVFECFCNMKSSSREEDCWSQEKERAAWGNKGCEKKASRHHSGNRESDRGLKGCSWGSEIIKKASSKTMELSQQSRRGSMESKENKRSLKRGKNLPKRKATGTVPTASRSW